MLYRETNPEIKKYRDLTLVTLAEGYVLVIACDSSGGIGPKQLDSVKVPGYVLGRLITRVALMEVLSSGARPAVLVNNVCVEPDPGAREIVRGIKEELRLAGLNSDVAVTGSTEKNVATKQTGLGITVIGIANSHELKLGLTRPGDRVVCIGIPKVGNEVHMDDTSIATLEAVMALRACSQVHDIVPVGSQGIRREAEALAQSAGVELHLDAANGLCMEKSAGPVTCVVLSVEPDADFIESISSMVVQPVEVIGYVT